MRKDEVDKEEICEWTNEAFRSKNLNISYGCVEKGNYVLTNFRNGTVVGEAGNL